MARPSSRLVRPEDLRRLVTVADPQISPDGGRVAFVRKAVGDKGVRETSLWIVSASGAGRATPLTRGPRDSTPRWSPDGSSLLFVRAREESTPQLAILRPDDRTSKGGGRRARASRSRAELPVRTLTRLPEGSFTEVAWSPDGTRVAFRWRRTLEDLTSAAARARKKSGASTPPLVIDDPWYRLDGDGYFGSARYGLYVLDVARGGAFARPARSRGTKSGRRGAPREVFTSSHLDDFSFDWSPDGRTLAVSCNRDPRGLFHPERTEIVLVDPDGRRAERAISGLPSGPKGSPCWSPDGSRLAWAGRRGRSSMYDTANVELWTAEITGGGLRPRARRARSLTGGRGQSDCCLMVGTLSDTADASFAPWIRWGPEGRSLFMRIGWHGAGRLASVNARGGAVRLHTGATADLAPASISTDGTLIACVRSAPTSPPEVAVVQVGGRDFVVRERTSFNRAFARRHRLVMPTEHWIAPGGRDVGAPRAVRAARSASGAPNALHAPDRSSDLNGIVPTAPPRGPALVHAWVMRPPPGAPRRNGAAVLEVHGGPHAQYGVNFFHEFQVLAAAGYTVVFSNPRGSKGYGAEFCAAIRGAWGTADWKDVQSVTSFMRRLPGIRAARLPRLGIMGGSYGGYMTNWAISHSREYRAAITDRCVSDLSSMCGSSDYPEVPDLYWRGIAWDRPQALRRSSPITFFKGVRTPTLIIHSEGDLRCNIEQGEQVHAALVAQNVPCRFVRYPRETSHGMSRVGPADLRIHRLRQILDWWAQHLA